MYSEPLNQEVIRAYLIRQKMIKFQDEYILNQYREKWAAFPFKLEILKRYQLRELGLKVK